MREMPRSARADAGADGRRCRRRRRGLGLRDQVGRRPRARLSRTTAQWRMQSRRGEDITARYPELARDRGAARRPQRGARRRGRRLRRRRAARASSASSGGWALTDAADGRAPRDARHAGRLHGLRPAPPRRRARRATSPTRSAASCSTGWGSRGRAGRRRATTSAAGAELLEAREAPGPRGRRREAPRQPLPARQAQRRVDQGARLAPPGVRDRRLDPRRGRARRAGSARCWSATTTSAPELRREPRPQRLIFAGGVGSGLKEDDLDLPHHGAEAPRALDEPASTRAARRPEGAARALVRARARLRGLLDASGPTRAPCASPPSRACATTRTRARSCARPSARSDCACRFGHSPHVLTVDADGRCAR